MSVTVDKSQLYVHKAQVANHLMFMAGKNSGLDTDVWIQGLADTIKAIEENKASGRGGGNIFQGSESLEKYQVYKNCFNHLLLSKKDSAQEAVKKHLAEMSDEGWEIFSEKVLEPQDRPSLDQSLQELQAAAGIEAPNYQLSEETKPNSGPTYNSRINQGGDFNSLQLDSDVKYQIGLAAGNMLKSPDYKGHASLVTDMRSVNVYVVDDMKQAYAVFGSLPRSDDLTLSYQTDEDVKNSVTQMSRRFEDGTRETTVLVSRDYLRRYIGQEIDFMKNYEEHAKDVTLYSSKGTKNLADFMEELKADSPLKVNSYRDFAHEQNVPAPAAIAKKSGDEIQVGGQ